MDLMEHIKLCEREFLLLCPGTLHIRFLYSLITVCAREEEEEEERSIEK